MSDPIHDPHLEQDMVSIEGEGQGDGGPVQGSVEGLEKDDDLKMRSEKLVLQGSTDSLQVDSDTAASMSNAAEAASTLETFKALAAEEVELRIELASLQSRRRSNHAALEALSVRIADIDLLGTLREDLQGLKDDMRQDDVVGLLLEEQLGSLKARLEAFVATLSALRPQYVENRKGGNVGEIAGIPKEGDETVEE